MAKKQRSPERAAAVLDRAARMDGFRTSVVDRRIGDPQMRTPGAVETPFRMDRVTKADIAGLGRQQIPLSSIRTEQPTVSLAAVKSKLAGGGRPPALVKHGDWYYVADGNHRITAARALGQTHIDAHVANLPVRGGNAPMPGARIGNPGAIERGLGKAAGPAAIASVAGLAYADAKRRGGSDLEAMGAAALEGGKVAALGASVAGMVKSAARLGPAGRIAAQIGSKALLPASVIGHAAAYGLQAYRRGDGIDGIAKAAAWGGVNGVVPVDLVTQAITSFAGKAKAEPAAAAGAGSSMPGPSRLTASQARAMAEHGRDQITPAQTAAVHETAGLRGFQNQSTLTAALAAQGKEWDGDYLTTPQPKR